jgi:mRNA degradation ribonuclease J1/J2
MTDQKPAFRPRPRPHIQPRHGRRPPIDRNRLHVFRSPQGDAVRVIVLGGLEEVGRNCTLIEYKNDIILIDMGLQFPEEDMPGIDYIIPNMTYLRGKEKNVRGVIITHGHYDHIGGLGGMIYTRAAARGDKEKPLTIYYPKGWATIADFRTWISKAAGHIRFFTAKTNEQITAAAGYDQDNKKNVRVKARFK